jgi:ketosteroid isomerase-like protein
LPFARGVGEFPGSARNASRPSIAPKLECALGHRTYMTPRDIVLAYLRAIEANNADAFVHADVLVIEHPNKLNPAGARYDRAALRVAAERGAAIMASQSYEVRQLLVDGNRVAAQIAWTGNLRDGRVMRAELATFIEIVDGKIWRQDQYDCFAS